MPGGDKLRKFLKLPKTQESKPFQKALSEYYKMIHPKADRNDPIENYVERFIDDIFWGIGQHYGLGTPILDWTSDPYKALFFAFCNEKENDSKRVVYGLAEECRRLMKKRKPAKRYIEFLCGQEYVGSLFGLSSRQGNSNNKDTKDTKDAKGLEGFEDLKNMIDLMFGRIRAQNGLFTRTLYKEMDVEKVAREYYIKNKENKVYLVKIIIDDSLRKDMLRMLEAKNITFKTIYPDVQGASFHCNLKLQLNRQL